MKTNFINLNYNLYDLLNVDIDSNEKEIKKNFNLIVKNYHPDKNSDVEIDIFNHIMIAKKILLDKESRARYNNFLNKKEYNDLKNEFNNSKETIEIIENNNTKLSFKEREQLLNEKHGYIDSNYDYNVVNKYNNIKMYRPSIDINKVEYKDIHEFNEEFEVIKERKKKIKVTDVQVYVPTNSNKYYTYLNDINKLYNESDKKWYEVFD